MNTNKKSGLRRDHRNKSQPAGVNANKVIVGDAVKRLRQLPEASVDTVVTSPPYFLLHDYGVAGQSDWSIPSMAGSTTWLR